MRGGRALRRVVRTASARGVTAGVLFVGLLTGFVDGAQEASSATILASSATSAHRTVSATSTYGTITATLTGNWHWHITNPRYLSAYETSKSESITFSESVTVRVPKCAITPVPGCLNETSDKSSMTVDVVGQPTMTIKNAMTSVTFQTAVPTKEYFTSCTARFSAGAVSPGKGSPVRIYFYGQQINVSAVPPTAPPLMVSSSTNAACDFTSPTFTSPWPSWSFEPVPDLKSVLPYKKTYRLTPGWAARGVTGTAAFTVTGGVVPCTAIDASASVRGSARRPLLDPYRGHVQTPMLTSASVCPQVIWENPPTGKSKNVTGKTEAVLVGQIVRLKVVVSGGAPPSASWTGFGSDAIDASRPYKFTVGQSVVPLAQLGNPIKQVFVTVAWSDPQLPARSIGVIADGGHASTTFEVDGPTFTITASRHCTLGIDTTVTVEGAAPGVYIGENDSCGDRSGITWDIDVSGVQGSVGLNQLVASTLVYNTLPCTMEGNVVANGQHLFLDRSLFVEPQYTVDTAFDSTDAHWTAEDSPGAGLKWMAVGATLVTAKSFRTSLMYRPPDGVWVALAQERWSYSATVKRTGKNGWQLLKASVLPTARSIPFVRPVSLSDFPSWSSTFPTDFAKGSC